MIIHIPFSQNVRLKSVLLKLGLYFSLCVRISIPSYCRLGRGESTPLQLRIYANHPNIVDFGDAETTKPQLDISLLEGETGVIEYPLRVAAFASVGSLSLFFVRIHYSSVLFRVCAERSCTTVKLSLRYPLQDLLYRLQGRYFLVSKRGQLQTRNTSCECCRQCY